MTIWVLTAGLPESCKSLFAFHFSYKYKYNYGKQDDRDLSCVVVFYHLVM